MHRKKTAPGGTSTDQVKSRYFAIQLNIVGLSDVQYVNDDGTSVESAVVKYADKTKSELTRLVLKGKMISRHTNPNGHL